jgi:hypothetical protein
MVVPCGTPAGAGPAGPGVSPLPTAALPPEAVASLHRAFRREVRVRVPRLLDAARQPGPVGPDRRADVVMLLEGCRLLGDAAASRALEALLTDLEEPPARRCELVDTVALLLGRWSTPEAG